MGLYAHVSGHASGSSVCCAQNGVSEGHDLLFSAEDVVVMLFFSGDFYQCSPREPVLTGHGLVAVWIKQKLIPDKLKIERIIMCSSTNI